MPGTPIRIVMLLVALASAGLDGSTATAGVDTSAVPVAEGIELPADVYHPGREPAPVVLIRTPYGRKGYDFLGEAFADAGYVAVVQDVRGKYDSGGEHEPFRHEESDGLATLRWIAAQPWCNGRIGLWGQSYSAFASLSLADADIRELRSILAFSGWLGAEQIVQRGGAMHLMLDLPWMLTQQGRRQRSLGEFDIEGLFRHTPLKDALRAAGITSSTWEDPSWIESGGERRRMGKVTRPVLHMTGWSDMVYRGSLGAWEELTARSKAHQKLIIGPWYHDQMMIGDWEVGDAHFGDASGFGADELVALSLRWFDATLRNRKNGFLRGPAVTYFLMEQNAWHTEKSWPPPARSIRTERWYLDSGGGANGREGDGILSPREPTGAAADHFTFDPMNPVPTLGGANFHFFPELIGVRDQREIERRKDVLVYTSPPLERELQITGKVSARLHVATSGKDTDFTAKLVAVRPDGYARIVEEGIARASALLEEGPSPGRSFSLEVDMGHTAISVPAGHRLRLEVSSSNFPKYDRNPNTGESPFEATVFRTAEQTVFHSGERASYISLPIRRELLVPSARGREPLIRPPERKASASAKDLGDDSIALLALGRGELDRGELDASVTTLERVVELRPEWSEAHFWLGRAYLAKLQKASMIKKLGLSKKVRSAYLRAIELDPENLDARSSLASFYFNAPGVAGGSIEKGVEQAEEIKKRDPRAGHLLLAGMYAGGKETAKARQEYQAAIALDPDDPDPYYAMGLMHQNAKEWDQAFEAFEVGVSRTGDLRSLYQIGRTGIFSGEKLDRAKQAMEQYIAAEPDSERLPTVAQARWRLGMIHERVGDREQARHQYEAALAQEPGLDQAREALETLGRSD